MQIAHPAPLPVVVAPASSPASATPAASGENSPFAKLLSAQQPPSRPASDQGGDREGKETPKSETHADQNKKHAEAAGRGRGAASHAARREATGEAKSRSCALGLHPAGVPAAVPQDTHDADQPDAVPAHDGVATPAGLADWLSTLNPPPTATPALPHAAAGDAGEESLAAPGVAAAKSTTPGGTAVAARSEDMREPQGALPAPAPEAAELSRTGTTDALAAAALDAHPADHRPDIAKTIELPSAPAAAATHAAIRTEGPVAAAPAINLSTPATTPEFREALGMQVSVLAREGVQRAELHLNPAEMGPISVQIALDGTRAQVDFGAESFATRQIIEAGLPELAAALRDAGFTLAGGGVSQHARGQSDGGGQAGDGKPASGASADTGADAATARLVPLRAPQGAVDLYA